MPKPNRVSFSWAFSSKAHTHACHQRDVVEFTLNGARLAGSLGELQRRVEQVLAVEIELDLPGDRVTAAEIHGQARAGIDVGRVAGHAAECEQILTDVIGGEPDFDGRA